MFTVDAQSVPGETDRKLRVTVVSPSGNKTDARIETVARKLYRVFYVANEEGIGTVCNYFYCTYLAAVQKLLRMLNRLCSDCNLPE
jgi:hypothetical protein